MCGPSSTSWARRLRKPRTRIRATRMVSLLDVEPDRHHEVAEVLAVDRLEQPGTERRAELDHELVAVDALDALDHELRVEGDLQRLAGVGRRDRLRGVTDL